MFRPDLLVGLGWRYQWDRYLRSHGRAIRPERSSVEQEDHLFHCVQDCWHLKDWIIADASVGLDAASVEAAVGERRSLRLVGDLANAAKHFRRSAKPGSSAYRHDLYVTSKSVSVCISGGPALITYTATLDDGSTVDVMRLIEEARREWLMVLKELGLSPDRI